MSELIAEGEYLLVSLYDETLDRTMKVAFIGQVNAGKSMAINSLFNEEVCPYMQGPTTLSPTTFVYSKKRSISFGETIISKDLYLKMVKHKPKEDQECMDRYHFLYQIDKSILKFCSLVDLPGFDNVKDSRDEQIALDEASKADVIVCILDGKKSDPNPSFIRQVQMIKEIVAENRKWILLINHCDDMTKDEYNDALTTIVKKLKVAFSIITPYSAKRITVKGELGTFKTGPEMPELMEHPDYFRGLKVKFITDLKKLSKEVTQSRRAALKERIGVLDLKMGETIAHALKNAIQGPTPEKLEAVIAKIILRHKSFQAKFTNVRNLRDEHLKESLQNSINKKLVKGFIFNDYYYQLDVPNLKSLVLSGRFIKFFQAALNTYSSEVLLLINRFTVQYPRLDFNDFTNEFQGSVNKLKIRSLYENELKVFCENTNFQITQPHLSEEFIAALEKPVGTVDTKLVMITKDLLASARSDIINRQNKINEVNDKYSIVFKKSAA